MRKEDKEDRKSIHDFIKVHFKNFTSNTISDKDVQYIDISHNKFKVSANQFLSQFLLCVLLFVFVVNSQIVALMLS